MAYLGPKMLFHLTQKAQITSLLAKKISVFKKYANFWDDFFKESAAMLSNCLNINKYVINLKPTKQPPCRPIYKLGLIELKFFKTYIEANLANKFI